MDFNGMHIFAAVVAKGSFSAAAAATGLPVATVSRKVAVLEKELDLRLLERSTRKLRLTEAGKILFEYATRGVEEFEAGLLALSEQQTQLKGRLRFSMPPGFQPIWPVLEHFQFKHPDVVLEVFTTIRRVDFIVDGIDVALRVGRSNNPSATAKRLGSYRHILVATPEFLQRHPIASEHDIGRVPCAAWGHPSEDTTWQLGTVSLPIAPMVRVNDYAQLEALVLTGRYLSELPPFFAQAALKSGRLVEVLANQPMPQQTLNLIYPSRKNLSRITRVFIDFVYGELIDQLADFLA